MRRKTQHLLYEINQELNRNALLLHKPRSWFRFAKKTKYGYRFLKNKEKQWEILEKISKKLAKKYKSYTTGEIVDMIAEMVNAR